MEAIWITCTRGLTSVIFRWVAKWEKRKWEKKENERNWERKLEKRENERENKLEKKENVAERKWEMWEKGKVKMRKVKKFVKWEKRKNLTFPFQVQIESKLGHFETCLEPKLQEKSNNTLIYWEILAARLLFVVVYQVSTEKIPQNPLTNWFFHQFSRT